MQPHHVGELGLRLVLAAVDVGVVLAEAARAQQARQRAAGLVAEHLAVFGDAQRQLAVRAWPRQVHLVVVRAAHRAQVVALLVDLDRRVHVVLVVRHVARLQVQPLARDRGRGHGPVAGAALPRAREPLELEPDRRAVLQPQRQADAHRVRHRVDVQLLAEHAVVALLRLGDLPQPMIQRRLRGEAQAVDARQLRALRVAAPVRAGQRHQPERADRARARDVRALAEVREGAERSHADRVQRRIDGHVVVHHPAHGRAATLAQQLDEFGLVGLVARAHPRDRALDGPHVGHEGLVARLDLAHAPFDDGQVVVADRLGELDVVVEAILDGGADAEAGGGPQLADGGGEQVGARVAHRVQIGRCNQWFAERGHAGTPDMKKPSCLAGFMLEVTPGQP